MAWEPYVTVDSQDVEALLYLREKLGDGKEKEKKKCYPNCEGNQPCVRVASIHSSPPCPENRHPSPFRRSQSKNINQALRK
jgi:hypothetical protein